MRLTPALPLRTGSQISVRIHDQSGQDLSSWKVEWTRDRETQVIVAVNGFEVVGDYTLELSERLAGQPDETYRFALRVVDINSPRAPESQ